MYTNSRPLITYVKSPEGLWLTLTGFDESGLVFLLDGEEMLTILFDAGFPEVDNDLALDFYKVELVGWLTVKRLSIDDLLSWE